MIVSHDGAWCICSPKKTATQSLEGMLVPQFASIVGEMHGSEWAGSGERILVVRNPYERLASMFWFALKSHANDYRPALGATEWCRRLLADQYVNKSVAREWSRNQLQLAAEFRPSVTFRLEDGLMRVVNHVGVYVDEQRRNVTGDSKASRKPFAETFALADESLRQAIDAWAAPDMEAWY